MSHSASGQPVELGVCLGFAIEPDERWGRLVGIRRDQCPPIQRYIVREYAPGDGEFPTGGYSTTSKAFLIAHEASGGCRESAHSIRRERMHRHQPGMTCWCGHME